jgi:EmrB/QacA subfamily drug resistance transporter
MTTATTWTAPAAYARRWVALAFIIIANVMDLLDSTIVNVGAPTIRADIGGSYTAIQWIAGAYTLAFAVGLIIGGRLGDLFGRKRLFLIGGIAFVVSSLLCSLAPTAEFLIVLRVIQGLSGAMLIPQGLGMMRTMFPPAEMPKAFGVVGPTMGLASVAGPVVAGALISANLFGTSWRSIFWINVPIGIVMIIGAIVFLPKDVPSTEANRNLDVVGMILMALGTSGIVYSLTQGRDLGWPWWIFALMVVSVGFLVLFAVQELRLERQGLPPLVTPSAFRKRSFSSSLVFGAVYFAVVVGVSLCFGLYLQLGLGLTPLQAGLTLLPSPVGIAVGSVVAGVLVAKLGRRTMQFGLVLLMSGLTANILVFLANSSGPSIWFLIPGLFVSGVGMGMVFSPFFGIALADVANSEVGSASGTLSAVQQFGSVLGVAVVGTLFFSFVDLNAGSGSHGADFTAAIGWTLVSAVALATIAAILTVLLPKAAGQQGEWE